jgi:hypothetical protein
MCSIALPAAVALPILLLAGCSATEEGMSGAPQRLESASPSGAGAATNLAALNSAYDDFAAALHSRYDNPDTAAHDGCDGMTFTSNRPRDAAALPLDEESRFGEMVYASPGSALSWAAPELLAGAAPNWGTAVPRGAHIAALFASAYRSGGRGSTDVLDAVAAGDSLNSAWWDSHPALSPSGELLVFASNRLPEHPNTDVRGRLQTDLYLSRLQADGSWGAPVKLPAPVNSPANELSPHFGADGWFYFASDRGGSAGFDIYRCDLTPDGRLADGAENEPQRLPEPINSAGDDLFPWMGCDGCTMYVSSNREGGQGGYDLWAVERFRSVTIEGRVALRRSDGSLEPAADLPIEMAPAEGGPAEGGPAEGGAAEGGAPIAGR